MLKFLVYSIVLICVAAVQFKSSNEEIKQLKREQERLYTRTNSAEAKTFLRSRHKHSVEPAAEETITTSYRLPNNTWPLHYDIHLQTNIHTGNPIFNGVVRINIDVLESTNSITLHSRLHIIQGLNLFTSNGSDFDTTLTYTYDSDLEFLTIFSSSLLEVGEEFIIEVTFISIMNDYSQRGFMINTYQDPTTDQTIWMGHTHFQPFNARHAFPCFDEPRYRQTFALRLEHDASYQAISTMPVLELQQRPQNFVVTVFDTTPPMTVIVLTFSVNKFDFVSATDNNTPAKEWRVFARPEAIEMSQADNALQLGVAYLQEMQNIFNIRDVLPKSDQIAMPQFIANGSGNWGFISMRENILLQTNADPAEQHFREMRLAHEYSHVFFGGLVSAESFTYIWLNEGFGTLYENIVHDNVFPEKRQWERFLIDNFDTSMSLDILDFVDPINNFADTRDEIRARFNFITNQKAALVLRMFQEALTDATWTKGLTYYLLERQFQSATPEDVFAGLQEAYDEDFPSNNLDVGAMMNPWLNLRGYPVVTVSRTEQGLIVTQEGFRTTHDELFNIPLNYATASVPNFEETFADFWLTSRTMEIPLANASIPWTDDDWIIFNLRDTGYYVTNYDDILWDLIINAMISNQRDQIHFLNRGTLFADLNRFIMESYEIRTTLYFDLLRSLQFEDHPHVWVRTNVGVDNLERRLRGTRSHQHFINLLRDILTPVYSGTEITDPAGRNIINSWSCVSGVANCLTDSLSILIDSIENETTFEFDFRCNGFMTADGNVWMHFFNVALQTSDRLALLRDLICTLDPQLIRFYLNQTIETSNSLTNEERQYMLTLASSHSTASYNTIIDFVEEYHQTIDEILPLEEIIETLSVATNTQCQAERLLELVRFIPTQRNPGRDHFRLFMHDNFEFTERNTDDFHEWFESQTPNKI